MLKAYLIPMAGLLAIAGLPGGASAAQQGRQPDAAAQLPSNEALDALVAANKWDQLGAALAGASNGEAFTRKLDWLQAKVGAGGGFFLVFEYAKELWRAGNSVKVTDPDKDPRVTAGFMTLYAYELIVLDGLKCADKSAAGHRIDQLLMYDRPILNYLKAKPEKLRTKIVDLAIAFEKHTAPLRKDDDVLCRSGLEEFMAGFEGGSTREVPPKPGQPGRSFEVTAPSSYAPRFLAPEEYTPLQEEARPGLRASLFKLIAG